MFDVSIAVFPRPDRGIVVDHWIGPTAALYLFDEDRDHVDLFQKHPPFLFFHIDLIERQAISRFSCSSSFRRNGIQTWHLSDRQRSRQQDRQMSAYSSI